MYHHVKKLMYTVRVGMPDPRFGNMLLEQFGGANGELAAAMQYSVQGLNCDDPERKDLLMDIGTEELSHLEVVGTLARMHLKPTEDRPRRGSCRSADRDRRRRRSQPVQLHGRSLDGGLSEDHRRTRRGSAQQHRRRSPRQDRLRTADQFHATIRARIDALQFLMTREITHMKAFAVAARRAWASRHFRSAAIPPTPELVDQYFNDSTGVGDRGEPDARGPWNEGGDWELVQAPAFQELESELAGTRTPAGNGGSGFKTAEPNAAGPRRDRRRARRGRRPRLTSPHKEKIASNRERIYRERNGIMSQLQELLVEELQDLLHAENQLVAALPKMASAAKAPKLREAFEKHLLQTQMQVERLNQAFELLGSEAESKPCRAMMGLIEEGQEKIEEGDDKEELASDLSLIAAAQKVEHYEIAAYGNARTLAMQIDQREAAQAAQPDAGRGRGGGLSADGDHQAADPAGAHAGTRHDEWQP